MTTVEEINNSVLKPYQNHRQLTINESELLSLELLDLLSTTYCKDKETLKYVANFLTKETYDDLIDERNLNKKCGYPLCDRSQNRFRDLYGGNGIATNFLKQHNPYAYLSLYCSKFHYRCSQFYHAQLSNEALFSRVGIHLNDGKKSDIVLLEEVIANNETREEDLKLVVQGIGNLDIGKSEGQDENESKKELEKDLSEWLSEVKIVENEKPNILGDLGKEDNE